MTARNFNSNVRNISHLIGDVCVRRGEDVELDLQLVTNCFKCSAGRSAFWRPGFCQSTARQCTQRQWQPLQERRRRPQPVLAEAAEQETAAPVESGVQRCKLCGVDLASAPRGCDNEGHVIKGLGSWPGFGWFEALRVYGACPEAQKKGIAYTRKGDTLDEIMFGKK